MEPLSIIKRFVRPIMSLIIAPSTNIYISSQYGVSNISSYA